MDQITLNSMLVSLFRQIECAVPSGTGSTFWCYMDYPREDVTVPRISVNQSGGGASQIGIGDITTPGLGTLGVQMETTYDIDVWVKQGTSSTMPTSWGYGTGKKAAGTQLRDIIGDLVIKKILDSRDSFCISGIFDIEIIGVVTQPFVDEYEWLRKTISVRIMYIKSHV